jgi:hypothetical protein
LGFKAKTRRFVTEHSTVQHWYLSSTKDVKSHFLAPCFHPFCFLLLLISSYRHFPYCSCRCQSVRSCSILISVSVCTWRPLLLHSRRAQQVLLSRIMSDVMSYRFIWLPAEYRSVTMATQHVSCALAPLSSKYYTRNVSRLQKLGPDVLQLQQNSAPHYPVQKPRPLATYVTKLLHIRP